MTNLSALKLEEFESALARWGADILNWPADMQGSAQRTLHAEPEAQAMLVAASAFEMQIMDLRSADKDIELPTSLAARILADAAEVMPKRTASARPNAISSGWARNLVARLADMTAIPWRPMAACAASAALGIWLGFSTPDAIADVAATMISSDAVAEFAALVSDDMMSMDINWDEFEDRYTE
jgi:hypothetical protein